MSDKHIPDLSQLADERLLALVKKGDKDAFDVLFERYKTKVFSFILRYVGDNATAEDVFQNTFIRLYTKARYFSHESKFSTWLYTIAANLCKDELKKRSIRKHIPLQGSTTGDKSSIAIAPQDILQSGYANPHETARAKERSDLVTKAIDTLPEDLRMVIILHCLHSLKYHEVAEILGIPTGTVQSRMHSALLRLRESLGKLMPDGNRE